ncbi:NADH-quinone oxidoreductase subunit L [Candidatus Sumerlaeota bacterium]|nr:NADH-quinone oxidoreductase subunit L [Candidatus Sumerlaeota bacterium]
MNLNIALGILLLPAASAIICGLFGKYLKEKTGWVATGAMLGTLAITAILWGLWIVDSQGNSGYVPWGFEWIKVGGFSIEAKFWVDELTLIMLTFVSLVGSMVFIYANGYMHGDPGTPRFFAYFSLFATAMFLLVLGANFPMLFIGWEGVGLCSYLLIGYYFDKDFDGKITCADAGRKAFITNRVGDFGFLLGMLFVLYFFGTLDFHQLFKDGGAVAGFLGENGTAMGWVFTAIALLLFIGATGKSAQIPLYIWLPDAMAGPTPVSALIHAATMVTAGVYMVARCNVFYWLSPEAMTIVAIIGALTAFVAASIGITQRDIKKVLAYSTVSQLGYMFLACGVGAFSVAIFHVFTHAFFKGCLFLCAGSVIHALHHEQDMTKMGGLKSEMPRTYWTYLISTLAISGIFPFAGFFSKDEILLNTYLVDLNIGKTLWLIGVATALMTAFYMFRSVYLTFHGKFRGSEEKWMHVEESPNVMTIPLIILAIGATTAGLLGLPAWFPALPQHILPHFLDHGVTLQGQHLAEQFGMSAIERHHISHSTELGLAVFSLLVAVGGWALAYFVYAKNYPALPEKLRNNLRPLWNLSWNLWYYNMFCMKGVCGGLMALYRFILAIDQHIVDGVVNGAGRVAQAVGGELREMQNGSVQAYAVWVLVGANIVMLFLVFAL